MKAARNCKEGTEGREGANFADNAGKALSENKIKNKKKHKGPRVANAWHRPGINSKTVSVTGAQCSSEEGLWLLRKMN